MSASSPRSRNEAEAAEELRQRNFWDGCHADNLLYAMRHIPSPWRVDLMEAHLQLCWHVAHEENERHDFCLRHGIKSALHIQKLVRVA